MLIGLDLKATLWQITKTSLELLFRYILCNKYNYCSKIYNQCSVHCTYIRIYCQALNIRFCKTTLNPKHNPQNMLTNASSHRNSASGYYPTRSSSSYGHVSWKTKSVSETVGIKKAIPTYCQGGTHHTYLIQKVPRRSFHQSASLLRPLLFSSSLDAYRWKVN